MIEEHQQPAVEVERHWLGNVALHRVSLRAALDLVAGWVNEPRFRWIVTPNVDHIVRLQGNPEFQGAYAKAALSLVDGKPVLWATRFLELPPFEKVSGSDLAPRLCRMAASHGWRVFFAGGHDATDLEKMLDSIRHRYPNLRASGYCPPRGFEHDAAESERLLKAIQDFSPQLLFMGCGAPKSEIWMMRHAERLGRGVGIGIGAGIRFLAGLDRRAPVAMQRLGLEWAWRLARDPFRLWKRYLIDDMRFFPLVIKWKFSNKKTRN